MRARRNAAGPLPAKLPPIKLRRRQMVWVLGQLGHGAGVSATTFYEYIKSLRKLGIPFEFGTAKSQARTLAEYSYGDVMELALVLSLRIYHFVPDSILARVVRHRTRLRRYYRKAYAERWKRRGSSVVVELKDRGAIELHGLFLDLGVSFCGGKLVRFEPRLLSPTEAVQMTAQRMLSIEMLLPLNISILAERVVRLATAAQQLSNTAHERPLPYGITMPKIITRTTALARGLKRYFTGKPCCRGHIAERHVNDWACVECKYQYQSHYARTPKGRAWQARANHSPKGEERFRRFAQSRKHVSALGVFAQSSKGRARTAIQSKPERT